MKFLAATALAIMAITAAYPCIAEDPSAAIIKPLIVGRAVLPPLAYDHPYEGSQRLKRLALLVAPVHRADDGHRRLIQHFKVYS
jgi:hypothetical protein